MSYSLNGTNSQYLRTSVAPASSFPCTISFWFNKDSTATKNGVFIRDGTGGGVVGMYFTTALRGYTSLGTVADFAATANYTVGTWHHACAVFASTTSRTVYMDAANSSTNTTNQTFSTANQFWIGSASGSTNFDGDLAEVGVWTTDLTLGEVTSLAKGMACNLVRPSSLSFYAPLIRDLTDIRGGVAITNFGSVPVAPHPRVYSQ